MGDYAIQSHAILLVLVQPGEQVRAQESTALRSAESVGVVNVIGAGVACLLGAVFEEGVDVPNRCHAQTDDGAAFGVIDQLVDSPGLESRWHMDVMRHRLDLFVLDANEGELVS